jgi:hypothetical protein
MFSLFDPSEDGAVLRNASCGHRNAPELARNGEPQAQPQRRSVVFYRRLRAAEARQAGRSTESAPANSDRDAVLAVQRRERLTPSSSLFPRADPLAHNPGGITYANRLRLDLS